MLGPFVPLAAKLGRLAMELAEGRAERITLSYYGTLSGYDTRLLTVAALNGAFQGRTEQPVNYVNAPVVAAERGIEVAEERRRACRDFTNLVRVEVDGLRVAGTIIGNENRHWLVNALGFELEMELAPLMVFFRYDDVPGVIGLVGTRLRRGRREHRQHGRLAQPPRRQGADGALARRRAAGRAGRGRARAGLRRRAPDPPAPSATRTEPRAGYPAERGDQCLARSRPAGHLLSARGSAPRCASRSSRRERRPRRTPRRRSAASSARSSSRSSSTATAARCWRSSRATGAPTPRRSPARPGASSRGSPAAKRCARRPASSPVRSPRSRSSTSTRSSSSERSCPTPVLWVGAGSERHMAALSPTELLRLSRARPMDVVEQAPYHFDLKEVA